MAIRACLDTRFYTEHFSVEASWTRRLLQAASQKGSRIISSVITISELVYLMTPQTGLDTVKLRIASAKQAGIEFLPVSEEIASMTGRLVLENKDLPLADAVIASTAILHSTGRVYTDDPHFKRIPNIHVSWGSTT